MLKYITKKNKMSLNGTIITDFESINFPNYLFFINAKNIQSTLDQVNVKECKNKFGTRYFESFLIQELVRHRDTAEASDKFFKDISNNEVTDYRFWNIKSASNTVIDNPNYFPLKINQLVVNDLQIGLTLSAPKKAVLPNYYQFLFENKIPAIHILLHFEDYFSENDMPQYHIPFLEQRTDNIIRVTRSNNLDKGINKNQLYLPFEGIEAPNGKLKISVTKGDIYNKGRWSETQVYFLILEMNAKQHSVKILQSVNWKDQTAISIKQLDELLAVRNHAFDGMQRSNVITHCRAGVGRTGTLLAAEVINQLQTPLTKTIVDLRDSRNNLMVQTQEQMKALYRWVKRKKYRFLHDIQ